MVFIQPVIPILTRLFLRPEATAVWRDGPAVDRGDSKQRTGPEFDSHWGPGKIYCYTDFVSEGERVGSRVFFQLMTDISPNQTTGDGVLFSSRCTLYHRKRQIFAHFDQFRLFCCEFTHFVG